MSATEQLGNFEQPQDVFGVADKIAFPPGMFGSPHLVIDDLLPEDVIEQINSDWPDVSNFEPETPGIDICHMYRHNYDKYAPFWASFNEDVFPWICAGVCSALSPYLTTLFGNDFHEDIAFGAPLSLMQANETYAGHPLHTHFYHNPDWIFTILFYVDPDDTRSSGTNLHHLHEPGIPAGKLTNYPSEVSSWTIDTAMRTFEWAKEDVVNDALEVPYTCNRLFALLDGPLAFHSVSPSTKPWDPALSRRRILRTHMKVDGSRVFKRFKSLTDANISASDFYRIMGPPLDQKETDPALRDTSVREFFADRLAQYSQIVARPELGTHLPPEVFQPTVRRIIP